MGSEKDNSNFDLVWAKQRYSMYWPARVMNAPPEMGKTPKNQVCVFFFGTKQFGFVEKRNVEEYKVHREKFVKKGRNNANFQRAVFEMDEFVADPNKNRSNAFARVIKIKTEMDIEHCLGIKSEPRDAINARHPNENSAESGGVCKLQTKTSAQNKNDLIASIVALKSENHQLCYQLTERDTEIAALKTQFEQKEQNIYELNVKLLAVESDLKRAEANVAKLQKDFKGRYEIDQKLINNLNAEKKISTARIKQLESGILLNASGEKNDDDKDENYEVERLIDDMWIGKTQYYHVRWRGYGPDDDTLEKAENLCCPSILKKYLKSKSKQN